MASHLILKGGERVLDLGTGCGILGIVAAEKAGRVIAVDVNPYAVECTRMNADLNGVSKKIEIRRGSMFSPIKRDEKFDLILFNPPYLPEEECHESGWLEKAWDGGASGRKWIDKFLEDFSTHLREDGTVLMVQSSLSDTEKTVKKLREKGFEAEAIAEKKFSFEKITLIRARRRPLLPTHLG